MRSVGETETDRHRLAGADFEAVVGGGLGADLRGIDRGGVPLHDERVEGVLDVGTRVGSVEQPLRIGVVLGEEQRRRAIAVEPAIAKVRMRRGDDARAVGSFRGRQVRFGAGPPVPRVAEPQRRQQIQGRGLRAPVRNRDANETFLRRRLRVFDEDVEVAVAVERAGVDQLVLELIARAARIRRHEIVVRVGGLGVLDRHFMYECVGVESR